MTKLASYPAAIQHYYSIDSFFNSGHHRQKGCKKRRDLAAPLLDRTSPSVAVLFAPPSAPGAVTTGLAAAAAGWTAGPRRRSPGTGAAAPPA